jgi:transglutaminase-like putative cysteine protease
MKKVNYLNLFLVLFSLVISYQSARSQLTDEYPQEWTYAVEINDVLCGYSESTISLESKEGLPYLLMNDHIMVKLSVLGGGVDMTIDNEYILDPETKAPYSIEHKLRTSAEVYGYSEFEEDKVYFTSVEGGAFSEIALPEGTIIENSYNYPHLMQDFILGEELEKSYQVYDDMRGLIATKSYNRVGDEEIELAGTKFKTLVLEEINKNLGTTTRLWLDRKTSYPVQILVAGRKIYLADKSVKKKINVVDMDNVLFAKVDKMIANVPDITYMKVEASIESAGEWIELEQLSFRGQKFTGTVKDNLIEGVFELNTVRYDGSNAPGFPQVIAEESLQKYLEPESLIESDHHLLIDEAKKITADAQDAWEATVLLSTWVGENIMGAVPGGTSAINTYKTREGECGSHSRLLTAFCRAVGIPARLSVGCMYSPYMGGSFGQHAWTEVYMGEAGWIPVDATAFEFDFVDAGHIRLGEASSFNPKSMKILEYKLAGVNVTEPVIDAALEQYLGTYNIEGTDRNFKVVFKDGSLAVDIPGQTVLALNAPDEKGVLYPKMTRQINFSFVKNDSGEINKMKLQQLVYLKKKQEETENTGETPEKFRAHVGNYILSQPPAEFKVFAEDGVLKVNDPMTKQIVRIDQTDDSMRYIDEFGKNEIVFERNPAGVVTGLTIYVNLYLNRVE